MGNLMDWARHWTKVGTVPIRPEDYFQAEITVGRATEDQPATKVDFG